MGGMSDIDSLTRIEGGTDGTQIGNTGDKLKVNLVQTSGSAINTIDYTHYKAHVGVTFYITAYFTLNSGGVKVFRFDTPTTASGKTMHIDFHFTALGATEFEIYEGVTSTNGTAMTLFNANRSSATTSAASGYLDSTFTGGTNIYIIEIGGGNNTTGSLSTRHELILKPDTKYAFKFTSEANGNVISGIMTWYENIFVAQ